MAPPIEARCRLCRIIGVGAPLRNWIFRLAISLALVGIVTIVLSVPVPLRLRLVVLGAVLVAGLDPAFRRLPAFDPLGPIRWDGPSSNCARRWALAFGGGPRPSTAAGRANLAPAG